MTQPLRNISAIFTRFTMMRLASILLFASLLTGLNTAQAGADPKLFPRPAGIDPAVKFWVKVFTDADTKSGYIHDNWNLDVIYEKYVMSKKYTRKQNRKRIKAAKNRYRQILSTLAKGKRKGLSKEEKRVLNLWPKGVKNSTLRKAKNRIRFQLGQADKFVAGLKRSGAWRGHILANLKKMGLPTEIAALPHVESSFNPKAYSSVGAAGLWQFTRSTGRRFMRVDHVVDERMDPFKASIAAAQLLENNYAVTGTWPLAITAYNHGAGGMRNATRQVGSKNIDKIIKRYKSRSFKFASRNFYTAFLAVNDIQDDYEKYFGPVTVNAPVKDEIVRVPAYMPVKALTKALGISKKELKRKNPALRPAVWNNTKYVPKGYKLRITPGSAKSSPKKALVKIASANGYKKQKPDAYHRVRRGQTLSTIAARYGVRVKDIASINNIRKRNRIRVGQVLRLPQSGKRYASTKLAKADIKKTSKKKRRTHKANKDGYYKVRRGDNIYKIAKRFKIKQKQLLALNNLNRRKPIYPGQLLLVAKQPAKTKKTPVTRPAEAGPVVVASLDKTTKSTTNAIRTPTEKTLTEEAPKQVSTAVQTSTTDGMLDLISENIDDKSMTTASEKPSEAPTKSVENILASHTPAVDVENETIAAEINNPVSLENPPKVAVTKQNNVFQLPIETGIATTVAQQVSQSGEESKTPSAEAQATAEMQEQVAALFADPSDYSVAVNKTIEIQASETLGHYAEWLGIRASRLRKINRMRYRTPVVVGQRIKLYFRIVSMTEFEKQRLEYHQSLQETYFEQYQITGTDKHKVRRGESLWKLAKRRYNIPVWLLRQYNPDLAFNKVQVGMYITFPSVVKRRPNNTAEESQQENG